MDSQALRKSEGVVNTLSSISTVEKYALELHEIFNL